MTCRIHLTPAWTSLIPVSAATTWCRGLVTAERDDLSDTVAPFARPAGGGDPEGEALPDIVRRVRRFLGFSMLWGLRRHKQTGDC